jgi:uncharacterized repeat protein (TIGR01451 family)
VDAVESAACDGCDSAPLGKMPSMSTSPANENRNVRGVQFALAAMLCALAGCTSGPFASNRPMGGESFQGNCVTGGLKKGCLPKLCPKTPAVPVAATPRPLPGMRIMPSRLVAPVNSEVILLAGLCHEEGYLTTHERIEWSLDNGSVGQFLAPRERDFPHNLHITEGGAQKISPIYAIGNSSRREQTLTRGTATTADDVLVRKGQAWITVTAASEGTSHITAYAPSAKSWAQHRNTATIHWVDAQWQLPAPAVNPPGGRQLMTTTVTRSTDASPIAGWVVRYEIAGGPPAGFGPQQEPAVEVPTDSIGQATVELSQRGAANGVNQINVSIIRPADPGRGIQSRIALGSGVTTATWGAGTAPAAPAINPNPTGAAPPTANPGIAIRATGPSQATVGGTAEYRFEIANTSGVSVSGITATAAIPAALALQGSNPQASMSGTTATWNVGTLGVGETRTIAVSVQPRQTGAVQFCADVLVAGQVAGRGCATTTVAGDQPLDISVRTDTGASQYRVGENVTFVITLANRGSVAMTGLNVRDVFDPGMQPALENNEPARREIELSVTGGLAANESRELRLTFRVSQPGRLCHTVSATSAQGHTASRQSCIDAVADAGAAATPGAIGFRVSGPPTIHVGQKAAFLVEATNTGTTPLANLTALVDFDAQSLEVTNLLGFKNVGGKAAWQILRLEPGQTLRTQIEFTAKAPNPASFVAIVVSEGNREVGGARASVAVIAGGAPAAQGGQLKLDVTDTGDPIGARDDLSFFISLQNVGGGVESDVVLEVLLPEGASLPSVQSLHKFERRGRSIRFSPIASMRPLQTETFVIRAKPSGAGRYELQATVTSRTSPQPQTQRADTTVTP